MDTVLRRVKWTVCLLAAVSLIEACGGDDKTPSPPPAVVERETEQVETLYAQVVRIPLHHLKLPDTMKLDQLTVQAGTAPGLTVIEGEIRFLTPGDPGEDQQVRLVATLPDERVAIPVRVRTTRPLAIWPYTPASEEGDSNPRTPPPLTITGLGPLNALLPQEVTFSIAGAPPLDPRMSGATAYLTGAGKVHDLGQYWTFDAAANRFVISAERMARLLGEIPNEDLSINVGLSAQSGDFGEAYDFTASTGMATLTGEVIGSDGKPATTLAGRMVAVRGFQPSQNPFRRVTHIDNAGRFRLEGLIGGMYEVMLLDPVAPDMTTLGVAIYPGTTSVAIQLVLQGASLILGLPGHHHHWHTSPMRN